MPRTVEHIVECHMAAVALRAAGRPVWSGKINIKSIIKEDRDNETLEHISAISQRIAKLIRSGIDQKFFDFRSGFYDSDFVDAIENMEQCTIESLEIDESNGYEAVEMFNSWLESIYDWGDHNRVWFG